MTRNIYARPSLLRRAVREDQADYYTSDPNPNLRRFVEEHGTPYDPSNDDYNVPPFDKPITSTKATAIYNMHAYWSKKPHGAIHRYIRHYTRPARPRSWTDDLVDFETFRLTPFALEFYPNQ